MLQAVHRQGQGSGVAREESASPSPLPTVSPERKKFRIQKSREKGSKNEEPSEERAVWSRGSSAFPLSPLAFCGRSKMLLPLALGQCAEWQKARSKTMHEIVLEERDGREGIAL